MRRIKNVLVMLLAVVLTLGVLQRVVGTCAGEIGKGER